MKYSWEFKLECVNKYKNREYIATPVKRKNRRDTFIRHVREWVKNYDDLGIDGLKHSPTNKNWTPEKRFELVAKVLAGNSISWVARNAHIDSGQLCQWVKRYNEKGTPVTVCDESSISKGHVLVEISGYDTVFGFDVKELILVKKFIISAK